MNQTKEIKVPLDLVKGILISAVSIFLILATPGQVNISREGDGITSRTFPYMIFGIMLACGILFILRGVFTKGEKQAMVFNRETARAWAIPVMTLLIVAGYVFLMSKFGYLVSSVVAVAAVLAFLRCKKWHYYAICVGTVFVIYFVFTELIQVQLPGLPF